MIRRMSFCPGCCFVELNGNDNDLSMDDIVCGDECNGIALSECVREDRGRSRLRR